ncbi:hypothetical protein AB6805_30415 [Chitinophaga sp. RCC_12]|uniref:hypothetical protein n=1 Tax=Chitinophaga sp. RCC_12 TaxID=3239226 RepID=UPI0035237D88
MITERAAHLVSQFEIMFPGKGKEKAIHYLVKNFGEKPKTEYWAEILNQINANR